MFRSISLSVLLALVTVAVSFSTAQAADQTAPRGKKVIVGTISSPALKYSCPNWQKWTFQGAGPAVAFQERLKSLGFDARLHAGNTFSEYVVHYRLNTPNTMRFQGSDYRERMAAQLQWFVGYRINAQVVRVERPVGSSR